LQILDEEPISIKEISLRTGLALSTLTNVIDKMEAKRLVRRRQSRTDRRMVKIELEFAGRTIKKQFNRLIRQLSTTFLVILSEADRANFTSAMGKIAHILSESSDQVPDVFGALEEPFRLILSKQFKKK